MKVWIIGSGGLLGRSLEQHVVGSDEVFSPDNKFDWDNSTIVSRQLAEKCKLFFGQVAQDHWTIYWCAGRGTLNSPTAQMHEETLVFENLLRAIDAESSPTVRQRGAIFFASSAGAVYAGSKNPPFTEMTSTKSLTPYGDAKIGQEASLKDLASRLGIRVLVGRISNIYGARQDLAKNQGLIATICYSVLRRQPVNLFVPLETSRNYIYVEDAARRIVSHTRKMFESGSVEKFRIKLIVAPDNLTIGSILNIARSVLRARPLVTVSTNKHGSSQPQSLVFKSVVDTSLDIDSTTGFSVGMKRVMADLQAGFLRTGWQRSS